MFGTSITDTMLYADVLSIISTNISINKKLKDAQ